MNIKKFLIGSAASAVMLASVISPAFADTVSVNFEPSTYTLGDINGQDGWSKTGSYDVSVVNNTFGYATFGTQSLRTSDAITSGSFGDQTFAKPLINAVGETTASAGAFTVGVRQTHFEMQFDIASTLPTLQTGMHLSVSPDRGDGSRMSYLRFEDQADGIHIFFDDVTDAGPLPTAATFNETDIATITRAPHTIKLTLDTLDGSANDVVNVYVDGVLKKTGTSWEDYYRFDPESFAEQSPRIVKTVLFRESGTATLSNLDKGFLIDNLTLTSGVPVTPTPTPTNTPTPTLTNTPTPTPIPAPTTMDDCKKNLWQTFLSFFFKNQGDCVSYVQSKSKPAPKATGDITMGGVGAHQRMVLSVFDYGVSSLDKGSVEYWNYDYPGPLHYTANVICTNVIGNKSWFMFQIPAGWPGLTGLYVVSYVQDNGTPGTKGDIYGHAATLDQASAKTWCETGTAPVTLYPITSGNVVVH